MGSRVRQGQLLATLDEVSMQNTYQAAKAVLKQAEDAYQRMKELHEKETAGRDEVGGSTEQVAAGSVYGGSGKEESDRLSAVCSVFRSHCREDLEVGQNVMPGVQVLKLVSDDRLKVRISVPETEIARVARGQKAVIEAPVLNGTKAEGVVTGKGCTSQSAVTVV